MIAFSPEKLSPLSFTLSLPFEGLCSVPSGQLENLFCSQPMKKTLHPILTFSTLKVIVKYFWGITSRLNNLLQLNIYSPKGTKNHKWVKDEVTAFNANCSLSHLTCGFILGFGGFFVFLYIALVTALPDLAHELLPQNPPSDFYFLLLFLYVVWHK